MWRIDISMGVGTSRSKSEVVSFGNFHPDAVIGCDKILQELMQSRLEDFIDVAAFQAVRDHARGYVAGLLGAVKLGQIAERGLDLHVTGAQRAGHLLIEDQILRDAPGLVVLLVDPAIAAMRGDRAQNGGPLEAVDLTADE